MSVTQVAYLSSGDFVFVDSLVCVPPIVCGGSVFGLCFVMHHCVSFLVLQSSLRGREIVGCFADVLPLSVLCGFSSRCRGLVCRM